MQEQLPRPRNPEISTTYWIPACAGMTSLNLTAIMLSFVILRTCTVTYKFETSTISNLSRHTGVGRNSEVTTTSWIPACAGMTDIKLTAIMLSFVILCDLQCDL